LRTLPGKQTPTLHRVLRKALPLTASLLLLSLAAALTGCGGNSSSSNPTGVTVTGPANDTIDPGDSASFSATVAGGPLNAGVLWSLTGCTVTSCGTLSNSTTSGVTYTAPSTVGTAFTVTLTASAFADAGITGTVKLNVPVNPAITTPAGALPAATFGAAYTTTLAATGGITPYIWTISQGALPAGLALSSSTGAITGSSTAAGTASFTVTLTDSGSPALTTSAAFTLTTAFPSLAITTAALPNGMAGTAYMATLAASGGTGTGYTYSVVSGTGLSAVGLSLSPSGVITGTPTTGETSIPVTVKVTDSAGNTAMATFSVTIAGPTLTITSLNLSSGVAGDAYTATLTATGGTGTGYTWSVTSGASSLSALGLGVSGAGIVSGAMPIAGTAAFTVKVTDSAGNTATANLTVTITASLTVTTATLPPGTQGTVYSITLAATGGSGTGYTWTVTSGTGLSAVGLSLSPSGVITGIPTKGETSIPVTVQVTDSAGNTATATFSFTVTAVAFQGQVLSGTAPVIGSTIQLYAAGATGNMSAAIPMLTQTVITDTLGMFQLNGLYTCGQGSSNQTIPATAQLYLVASGGTTSTTSTTSNPALTMVTAIGPCTNLTSTSFDTINELTTAAAAWALAPFASSTTNIGATSTNTLGLTNAFLDAALLANPSTGSGASLATNLSVETSKLAALADALNTCTTGQGTGCGPLFMAAGASATDTFAAALNIVHNPGQNVAAVFATIPANPPFPTTLTASPNDWTMSLTVTGGGLYFPTALGIDSQNNVWVADEAGPLSAFTPQGTPLSSTGFGIVNGSSIVSDVYGLAIDPSDNIWVTNEQAYDNSVGSVTEFYGVKNPTLLGQSASNAGYGNVYYPDSIAADSNGNIYAANTSISSATIYNSTGGLVSAYVGSNSNLAAGQNAIALDTTNGFWLSSNSEGVAHFSLNGTLLANVNCCAESLGIATDSAGDVWIADYLGGTATDGAVAEAVTDSSGNTTVPIQGLTTGGINFPATVAVDAAQNVWFTNRGTNSITELTGVNGPLPVGTAISPSTGVHSTGGYGLDAGLVGPYSLLPDRSGNLWVSNEGFDSVTMFFGLAAPTATPLRPTPIAP
jgi:hypothetical protein